MSTNRETKILFREVQSWARMWFRPLAVITLVLFGLMLWILSGWNEPEGQEPVAVLYWIGRLLVFSLIWVPLLFWSSIMVTKVREDGVHIRYWPLHLFWHRHIRPESIIACERKTMSFGEVTGWGIHTDFGEWVYNVRGYEFVRLKLINKKEIVIGTQRPEELIRAIEEIRKPAGDGGPA